MKIGLLHSTIRGDEKLLLSAARGRKIDLVPVDIRKEIFDPNLYDKKFDVVIQRSLSSTLGVYATEFFESIGIPVVNPLSVVQICIDKFATSLVLQKNKIPTIPFAMAFTEAQAVEAIKNLGGYPVVIKPASGSWGRLLAKINDQDALEAVLEQKSVLGSPAHKAFYIQKFVNKPGRDIRVTTAGNKVICAIYRETEHWITNTARGAKAIPCKVDKKLESLSKKVSKTIGGGILGIDFFEENGGYVVNEVNHTTEFKNVQAVTGVDVAGAMLDYAKEVANGKKS